MSRDRRVSPKPSSIGIYRPGGYAEYVTVPRARYCVGIEGVAAESPDGFGRIGHYTSAVQGAGASKQTRVMPIIHAGGASAAGTK